MSTITDHFTIVLQKGIEGGFAPPTPQARYTLVRRPQGNVLVLSTQTRLHGTPELSDPRFRELKLADHAEAIARLQAILSLTPTQYPGSLDLYGRNTSIVQATDESSLVALHMTGSEAGRGIAPPTEEQKALFDEAVAIIEKLTEA